MNGEARSAIEALRIGVPSRAAVRQMGCGAPELETAFEALLDTAWDAIAPPGLGFAGGFGSGKSHLLFGLAARAEARRFVVSRVVVSKETPLSDLGKLFESALRNAALPGRNDEAIGGAIETLIKDPDRLAKLMAEVGERRAGFAGVFPAALHLLSSGAAESALRHRIERFLAGAPPPTSDIRNALGDKATRALFDLKPPPASELALQRVRFAARLFRAAGYQGWCLLLDEVELIGRYGRVQRALAYAWLGAWIRLNNLKFPGIVGVYAISDDFGAQVLDPRQDAQEAPRTLAERNPPLAALAGAAVLHIQKTLATHQLRAPSEQGLAEAEARVRGLYQAAYDWPAPPLPASQRRGTRVLRHYIKEWILLWDLQRLGEAQAPVDIVPLAMDLGESADPV